MSPTDLSAIRVLRCKTDRRCAERSQHSRSSLLLPAWKGAVRRCQRVAASERLVAQRAACTANCQRQRPNLKGHLDDRQFALLARESAVQTFTDIHTADGLGGPMWAEMSNTTKQEAENERIILIGQSKGVRKHNRRAKALLGRAGTPRPPVQPPQSRVTS